MNALIAFFYYLFKISVLLTCLCFWIVLEKQLSCQKSKQEKLYFLPTPGSKEVTF